MNRNPKKKKARKKLTRRDLLEKVNRHREGGPPLTMKQWQRALAIARHKQLAPVGSLDRLGKGR